MFRWTFFLISSSRHLQQCANFPFFLFYWQMAQKNEHEHEMNMNTMPKKKWCLSTNVVINSSRMLIVQIKAYCYK
jgi:hypothetical protein